MELKSHLGMHYYVLFTVYGTLPFRYFALQVRCPSELCPSGTLPFTKYEG